ncbi:hypothetical protein H2O64_13390 [Kordia sp. YSTF-M3]|uniref:Bacteriocin n=1 Tax=Kordia aestuariivivens TaxID=2759037 RepID=A0ABR7QAS2_9FLAO|nr:hypothetical protein [Kordia aestuariivivens]MBC8755666.1 hypothetical protein [Kordia aestuariivivens]
MKKKNFKSLKLNKSIVNSFSVFGGEGKTEMCGLGSFVVPVDCPLGPRDDTYDVGCSDTI